MFHLKISNKNPTDTSRKWFSNRCSISMPKNISLFVHEVSFNAHSVQSHDRFLFPMSAILSVSSSHNSQYVKKNTVDSLLCNCKPVARISKKFTEQNLYSLKFVYPHQPPFVLFSQMIDYDFPEGSGDKNYFLHVFQIPCHFLRWWCLVFQGNIVNP